MEWIKLSVGFAGAVITYLVGGIDLAFQALVISMIIDYITGVIRSAITGKLNSATGIKGILKKLGMLILVCVANMVDQVTLDNTLIRNMVVYYLVANECLSIVENLGEAGVPIPQKLKNAILTLKKQGDEDDEKEV